MLKYFENLLLERKIMFKILLISLLAFTLNAKSLFSNSEQAKNAKFTDSLKNLIIATQKTRGLTNGFLNGNESNLLLIHANKRDMKKSIGKMEEIEISRTVSNKIASISQTLTRLNNSAFDMKASKAFKAYTEQINQMLMLAQTNEKQSSKDLNEFGKTVSKLMMTSILPLTEEVGRMRGLGSGIIAKGEMTKNQKFEIIAMLDEIQVLQDNIDEVMNQMVSSNKDLYPKNITKVLRISKKLIREYFETTKENFLSNGAFSMDSSDYFDRGTGIISELVNIYDANTKALSKDSEGWI